MKVQESLDEYYKQIIYSNDCFIDETNSTIRINSCHRTYLLILIFLILISQSNALPISRINYHHIHQPLLSFPMNKLDTSTRSVYTYKVYRSHSENLFKRERYRRTMIDRLFSKFDEDVDGQLSKDELYSLSLRLNLFPRFHNFLKKNR